MKKLTVILLGIFCVSGEVFACQDCVKEIHHFLMKTDEVLDKAYSDEKCNHNEDVKEAYRSGLKLGFKVSIDRINLIHPGTKFTLSEWEALHSASE